MSCDDGRPHKSWTALCSAPGGLSEASLQQRKRGFCPGAPFTSLDPRQEELQMWPPSLTKDPCRHPPPCCLQCSMAGTHSSSQGSHPRAGAQRHLRLESGSLRDPPWEEVRGHLG